MKAVKKLLVLLMVMGMFVTNIHAAESTVTYNGGEGDDKWTFTSEGETVKELFVNFKGCMPGDKITQDITVTNNCPDFNYVKIYVQAVHHDSQDQIENIDDTYENSNEFLNKLYMTVKQGETEIFSRKSPDQEPEMDEPILLGTFEPGESTKLTVTLEIPIDLGNEFSNREGEVDWLFTVEGFNLVEVTVTKKWEDDSDRDMIRPDSITVHLLANGEDTGKEIEISEDEDGLWKGKFSDLDSTDEKNQHITYSVTEDEIDGYTTEIKPNEDDEYDFEIVNKHEIDTTAVKVTKQWEDDDNRDGIRPDKVVVKLLGDGEEVDSYTLVEKEDWTHTFENLPLNNGKGAIKYTVIETGEFEGYDLKEITGDAKTGFVIVNEHKNALTNIYGNKKWEDDNDRDRKRPEAITVILKANGTEVERQTVTAEDDWAYAFENLNKNEAGKEIEYTVDELPVEGYEKKIEGVNIVNSYSPETVTFTVVKIWNDQNNKDKKRTESVHLTVYANGEECAVVDLSEENQWTHTFEALPKNENGEEIEYVIEERSIDGYATSVTGDTTVGFEVKNTHIPHTGDRSVNKMWVMTGAASLVCMALLLVLLKKRKAEQN